MNLDSRSEEGLQGTAVRGGRKDREVRVGRSQGVWCNSREMRERGRGSRQKELDEDGAQLQWWMTGGVVRGRWQLALA